MKPIKLYARNFMSFKELGMDFSEGLTLIDGWNYDESSANGSGKTVILECTTFAVFGETPRGMKVDEIPNLDSKGDLFIQFDFSQDDKICSIINIPSSAKSIEKNLIISCMAASNSSRVS